MMCRFGGDFSEWSKQYAYMYNQYDANMQYLYMRRLQECTSMNSFNGPIKLEFEVHPLL